MRFRKTDFVVLWAIGIGLLVCFYVLPHYHTDKNERIPTETKASPLLLPAKDDQRVTTAVVTLKEETQPDLLSQSQEINNAYRYQELIFSLENDDFYTSQEAADSLAGLGKDVIPPLLAALPKASVTLKGQIIFLLGRIGDAQAVPSLLTTLEDENAYIRRNSAVALGKIKDPQALCALTTSLVDDEPSVRAASAWALGHLHDTRATGDLLDALEHEADEPVKYAIVAALNSLQDRKAISVLLAELTQQYNQNYKDEIIRTLGTIGDAETLPVLLELRDTAIAQKGKDESLNTYINMRLAILEDAITDIKNHIENGEEN